MSIDDQRGFAAELNRIAERLSAEARASDRPARCAQGDGAVDNIDLA
jgi:hypothetical protein